MSMGNARGFMVAAVLLIVATTLVVPAQASSLRNGASAGANSGNGESGEVLWTYYDTFGAPGGAGDNIIRLVNPNGAANPLLVGNNEQDVCAMIYVFDDDEEMGECCGCPLSS